MEAAKSTGSASGKTKDVDPVGIFTAVLAVLGAAGWITFIGGAILWIGFAQAGLPAAETVARIPTSTLIATGAEFVTWAVLAAVLVIGCLALVDQLLSRFQNDSRDNKLELLRGDRTTAEETYEQGTSRAESAELSLANRETELKQAQDTLLQRQRELVDESPEVQNAKGTVETREGEVAAARRDFRQKRSVKDDAKANRDKARKTYTDAISLKGPAIYRILFLGLGLAAVTAYVANRVDLGYASISGSDLREVLALSLLVGAFGVAAFLRTSQLRALAVVAFFGIPLVMAAALYDRASNVPEVEPVAVLLKSGDPLVGVFVAQTTDRVVLGTFERVSPTEPEPGADENQKIPVSLQTLAKEDVAEVLVGPRLPLRANDAAGGDGTQPRSAREWAGRTALALCASAHQRAVSASKRAGGSGGETTATTTTTAPAVAAPKGCSSIQRADIHDFLNAETAIINDG